MHLPHDIDRGPEEAEGEAKGEGDEHEAVHRAPLASPRPPQPDRDEVVKVREENVARPTERERAGEEHRPRGREHRFPRERPSGDDDRAKHTDEAGGERGPQPHERERREHGDQKGHAAMKSRPHDEVARVRHQVRNAENDGPEREKPERRQHRQCKRGGGGEDAIENDTRIAVGEQAPTDDGGHARRCSQEGRTQGVDRREQRRLVSLSHHERPSIRSGGGGDRAGECRTERRPRGRAELRP